MEKSFYFELVKRYFPQLVLSIVEKVNGKNQSGALTYLYREFLTPNYAADGRWASVLADHNRVAADVVALSSPLPIKSREAIETASGKLPKLGIQMNLGEQEMKNIDYLLSMPNSNLNTIYEKVFKDTPIVITAIYERLEDMFLSGLSTGVALAPRNEGTGIRISYGYKDANKFGVKIKWEGNSDTSTPLDDIQKVVDKAELEDGNKLRHLFADDNWLREFYKSKQVREQYAFNMDFVGNNIPVLDFNKAASVVKNKWDIQLHRVARSIKTEVNGVKKNHNPWQKGVAVFACDDKLGSLVWTDVAEQNRRVNGVVYENADDFILVSKYSHNNPLEEITSSQAMVAPVIDNVDRIYVLDSTSVQA